MTGSIEQSKLSFLGYESSGLEDVFLFAVFVSIPWMFGVIYLYEKYIKSFFHFAFGRKNQ